MRIVDGRTEFYQWDCNQQITSTKFKDGDIVHFTNIRQKEALSVIAKVGQNQVVADVPNILLTSALPITVYIYADDHTKYEYTFKVKQRAKPSDFVYTETEILTIETAVNKALEEAKASGEFDGKDGRDGVDGKDGAKGEDGKDGQNGQNGQDGADGADGYTPVKGVDYWTDSDKAEIQQYIDTQFGDIDTALDSILAIQNELIGG